VPDGSAQTSEAAAPDSGNAVVIDHGHGWHSQYSHLRRGSLTVGRGARVEAGARLGLIGRSGTAAFPHLHFELRRRGRTIDPFTGLPAPSGCGRAAAPQWTPLWSPAAQANLAYRAGGLLAAGFAAAAPSFAGILEDGPRRARLAADAPALVFWAASWGLREGDRETMRILGPDGRVLVEETGRLPRNQAQWLRHAGAKRQGRAFPPGRYRGEYRITRETGGHRVTVVAVSRTIELR
jgi:murein DD-endopeptidase MepM/ murein hydrolase activator NlpD